jgi:hypothetical protein
MEHYMMKELFMSVLNSADKRKGEARDINEVYVPKPQSFSRLYDIICTTPRKKGGNPGISRTTVQRHLDKKVKARIWNQYPKRCNQYNQTFYALSNKRMLTYFVLLVRAMERHPEFKPPSSGFKRKISSSHQAIALSITTL